MTASGFYSARGKYENFRLCSPTGDHKHVLDIRQGSTMITSDNNETKKDLRTPGTHCWFCVLLYFFVVAVCLLLIRLSVDW